MASVTFYPAGAFSRLASGYRLLPFRFLELRDKLLLVNEVGEYLLLEPHIFRQFHERTLSRQEDSYRELKSRHFLYEESAEVPVTLLATKYRTKREFLAGFTKLHIFVVSLRCDHSCHYCQVSRVSPDRHRYDMSVETATQALDLVFRSPAEWLKIEFQGGEPLLNFDVIRHVVQLATERAAREGRNVEFVITSNLAYLTDDILRFCREYDVLLSTSLDGPAELHNANRPRPGNDSHALTVLGIDRAREVLGFDRVSALMTTTRLSLAHGRDIVDEYLRLNFNHIVVRPISPYGFALRTVKQTGYETDAFIDFYKNTLDYILHINREGGFLVEGYAKLLLTKIVTPYATGYVDLQSPAGAGISVAVYNYDGDVYPTDESRMLAETGDRTFRLGNVHNNTYEEIFNGELIHTLATASCVESLPGCADCALQTYCGSDPVENYATQRDLFGHRPTSAFCRRNMEIIKHLISLLNSGDEAVREILMSWVTGAPPHVLLRRDASNALAC